uniref:Uncharacterized protein n=1 Tax=Anguilla anguilla TaxID=7936 RepID=A0A0E9U200_ANGAN
MCVRESIPAVTSQYHVYDGTKSVLFYFLLLMDVQSFFVWRLCEEE